MTGRLLAAIVALVACCASAADAQEDARSFYKGKQLQFFTMGGPGGGYDAYTRAIGAELEKRLGLRSLTINEPAAGGLVAMNRLLNARPDGLSILLVGGEALATAQLFGEPGVNYQIAQQTWIARVSAEKKVVVAGAVSPFKTISEMIASPRPVIWAGSSKTDGNTDFQAILAYATGMKARLVIGYKGTGGINLALQDGEADARVVSDESAVLTSGPSSGMRTISTLARERSTQFPDIPTVFEAASPSPEAARALDWRAGVAALGRVIAVTPGTPPERTALMRDVISDILNDPAFGADMRKLGLTVSYASGDQVERMVSKAMTTLDPAGLDLIKDITLNRYF